MIEKIEADFSFFNPHNGEPLKKHWNFFASVQKAAAGEISKNFFHFGGGVNGGKTYTCLISLIYIAENFPGCSIHIVRESLTSLIRTTVQSFSKLAKGGKWYRSSSNYRYEFKNGSVVYFMSEDYNSDKDFDRFKGLETNIFFLEQIEELQYGLYEIAKQRVGRWKVKGKKMPRPLILTTFNPTSVDWVRQTVYLPYSTQTVKPNTYIEFITYRDNPFITPEEIEMYEDMDELHKRRYLDGDWECFDDVKMFLYSFSREKHLKNVTQRKGEIVHVSFDFNVDPITCILFNVDKINKSISIFKEIKLKDSNVHEICDEIRKYDSGRGYEITGDASERKRNVAIKNNQSVYDMIRKKLNIVDARMKVPRKNLFHTDSRLVCNTVLEHYTVEIDNSCIELIKDIISTETKNNGAIDKSNKNQTHLFDCFRYAIHTYFAEIVLKDNF